MNVPILAWQHMETCCEGIEKFSRPLVDARERRTRLVLNLIAPHQHLTYPIGRWKRWATSPECERDFPTIRTLTQFQRVLLVQALRPDRLQSALHQFASEVLRVTSLSPPAQSLEQLFEQESSGNLSVVSGVHQQPMMRAWVM